MNFIICHKVYGIESFGESGKDKDVFEHFGFSVSKLVILSLANKMNTNSISK